MAGIEAAVIALGASVVKAACKVWLGDRQFAADVSADLIDGLAGRLTSRYDQRRVDRFFQGCADVVSQRLESLLDAEFRNVPGNEREAAVLAVRDTIAATPLTEESLFSSDLDTRLVERQMRPAAFAALRAALLSRDAEELYWLVLRESCAYLVEVVTSLPTFQAGALTEILQRETLIIATLTRVLDRLPERRSVDDFAADYRRVVANKLDRMELFGITLAAANRRYPLSIAYIDLAVVHRNAPSSEGRLITSVDLDEAGHSGMPRAQDVIASDRLALVLGPAGSGKTTLLQWLAVRSARADFTGSLASLNGTVPFFIPLRRYVGRPLPAPEEFPLTVGANIAVEMPPGWVHEQLRAGRAIVLVDGVDEMPADQRDKVEEWFGDLAETFPRARFLVSSRPSAIGDVSESRLAVIELQQMSLTDVASFVGRWHAAVAAEVLGAEEKAALADLERALLTAIDSDRYLRSLAVTPLLCALLCALNRERNSRLPADRMEVYAAALDMLLDRRDRERGVHPGEASLSKGDKVQLLQDIAFWFVRNGWSDAPTERVVEQVARIARQLRGVNAEPAEVFRALLERSGLIREPVVGQIDFLHRTFQEYLAGKAAAEDDEIGLLLRNSDDDQWREVIVMAAGHARAEQCAELLRGLLAKGGEGVLRRQRRRSIRAKSLAIACARNARRIDPELASRVNAAARQLVPPSTTEVADALVGVGDDLFGMLRVAPPRTIAQATASIYTAARIGGPKAITAIAEILAASAADELDSRVELAVLDAWHFFRPDEYMNGVLVPAWPPDAELTLPGPETISTLRTFSTLTKIRCDLYRLEREEGDLGWLTANPALSGVRLTGCGPGLDLSPLARLPHLAILAIECPASPPDLAVLGRLPSLRQLGITCDKTGPTTLPPGFPQLGTLLLSGWNDTRTLRGLAPPLPSLRVLSLTGFAALADLAGIEQLDTVLGLELLELPQVKDLTPLTRLSALESLSVGILRAAEVDLAPLAALPRLREVIFPGVGAVDLTALAGKRDLVVRVPDGAAVTGVGNLGTESQVIPFTDAPFVDPAKLTGR